MFEIRIEDWLHAQANISYFNQAGQEYVKNIYRKPNISRQEIQSSQENIIANGFKMYKVLNHEGKKHKVHTRKKRVKKKPRTIKKSKI